jgi:hypothetical protein
MKARFLLLIAGLLASASAHAQDSTRAYLDPVDYGAFENKTNADATTRAWIACIADAIARNRRIRFKGDHLLESGIITINAPVIIEGNGVRVSRIFARGNAALLTHDCGLEQSTGRGIQLRDFAIVNESTTTTPGSVGILLTNSGRANNAFSWISNLVVSGFHDGIILRNQYFYTVSDCYIDNYRRYGIQLSSTWTYDAGDGIIRGCWIQPLQPRAGSGFDPNGANIRVEQAAGTRVTSNKIFPGHRIGIHVHANGTWQEQVPSGMLMISMNQFDSFGSNKDAIVIDSDWGRRPDAIDGISGRGDASVDPESPAQLITGNKIGNVQIVGNNLSNVGRLLTIRTQPGCLQKVDVVGNTAIGGGGVRIMGAVDGLWIDGNFFDNRSHGGPSGSGHGDDRPVYVAGILANATAGMNKYIGFNRQPDLADACCAPVLEPAPRIARVFPVSGIASIVPVDTNIRQSHEIVADQNLSIAFRNVRDGDEGTILIRHSGAGRQIYWSSPPAGHTLVWETGSAGTFGSADGDLDLVRWEVRGTVIIRRLIRLTSELEGASRGDAEQHEGIDRLPEYQDIGEVDGTPYLSPARVASLLPPSLSPSVHGRLVQNDRRSRAHRIEGAGLPFHRNGDPG